MSQYPPPPTADQQHYAPIYPAAASAQLIEAAAQGQPQPPEGFNFSPPTSQSLYAKIEPSFTDPNQNQGPPHDGGYPGNGVHVDQQHHPMSMPPPPPPPGVASVGPDGQPQKANRLRKACDSCSIRKVKCDESGPPCRACAALDIPCTFDRPSRRRGPPNRHAEAIKKRRLEGSPNNMSPSSPSSPTNAAHALAALSSHPPLSAESIAPLDTIEHFINDYFTYIHPLCPFPHEPSFRESFRRREDYNNRPFLALLASMIAALVSSFPRKPRLVLKAQGRQSLFPNHMSLIARCQQVCAAARGPALLERDDLTVYDAATSYLVGLSHAYIFRWRPARLYFAEALSIIRALGLHDAKSEFYRPQGNANGESSRDGVQQLGPDYITLEMGRRIFWTTFVSWRSMAQSGSIHDELVILPETPGKPYPPLPMEVDDLYIYPNHIEAQPSGVVPELVGFNANVKVYQSYTTLATTELTYGINEVFDWERQSKVLDQSLRSSKRVLEELPPELSVWLEGSQENQAPNMFAPGQELQGREPLMLLALNGSEQSPEDKRKTQYEIQKANIYLSQLATRSYITERYFNMRDINNNMKAQNQEQSSPAVGAAGLDSMLQQEPSPNYDALDQEMTTEKDKIVKDLLRVLQSISQVHMEPNADSFTHKVRQIVSTLLNEPQDRKSSVALQAEQYLHHFLEILVRLDRARPTNPQNPDAPEDEEAELKNWADLREYQVKIAQAGGALSLQGNA
ncbi:putative zn 2cys6 transcription factor protein [Lasiodiplodia theobromae]|uniref:Zn 2cys6 transcription factor protein n=2 Tax=Lasiodiplodia TaxID=66739 RepID=A0A8H7MCN7_9PEZI|nr:Zn 2cys6 transcription factor protein [Lasiodiplodia theobromae]KAF4536235.1 Zn 2cys6 transcription factor protein [Lasiodiplodia theobromae]KAF9630877.1 putative zn 2cys6 transcription factor protein [Lasiodiplodia theobromae]KAK0658733.1 putative transcriptional regulatory protein [Lasiodiplodia hormozganensis]